MRTELRTLVNHGLMILNLFMLVPIAVIVGTTSAGLLPNEAQSELAPVMNVPSEADLLECDDAESQNDGFCTFKFGCGCPPDTTSCTICDPDAGLVDFCRPNAAHPRLLFVEGFPASSRLLLQLTQDGVLSVDERAVFVAAVESDPALTPSLVDEILGRLD